MRSGPLHRGRSRADDSGMSQPSAPLAPVRPIRWARVAVTSVLWAAPLGIALAIAVLVASAPYFRPGPDTPTAGDARAWNAIWAALAVFAVGGVVGLVANLAWLIHAWRRAHRPRPAEWARVIFHIACGVGFAWLWFGR